MSTILRYPEDSKRHTSSIIFKINTYASGGKTIYDTTNETFSADPNSSALSGEVSRMRSGAINSIRNTFDIAPIQSGTAQEWFPQKKRLSQIISLYMPHSVVSDYGASYSEIEAGGLLGSVLKDVGSGKGLGEIATNVVGGAVRKYASELATVGLSSITDQARALVGKVTRNIENPRKEIVFEGMSIRRFQFTFDFQPRSETESYTVKEIIKLFKEHMHPEINNSPTSNGMYLTYPNDFDIEFSYRPKGASEGSGQNDWVNKINTCVLEGMSVDYTGGGSWQSFYRGAPTHIRLTLAFKELEPLTRAHIQAGY